jgi:hypothetical protein
MLEDCSFDRQHERPRRGRQRPSLPEPGLIQEDGLLPIGVTPPGRVSAFATFQLAW